MADRTEVGEVAAHTRAPTVYQPSPSRSFYLCLPGRPASGDSGMIDEEKPFHGVVKARVHCTVQYTLIVRLNILAHTMWHTQDTDDLEWPNRMDESSLTWCCLSRPLCHRSSLPTDRNDQVEHVDGAEGSCSWLVHPPCPSQRLLQASR